MLFNEDFFLTQNKNIARRIKKKKGGGREGGGKN